MSATGQRASRLALAPLLPVVDESGLESQGTGPLVGCSVE